MDSNIAFGICILLTTISVLYCDRNSGLSFLLSSLFLIFFLPQEQKLKEEIQRLNGELNDCDEYIKSRKTDITTLESVIAQSRERLNHHKVERDKLQDERKYVHLFSSVL